MSGLLDEPEVEPGEFLPPVKCFESPVVKAERERPPSFYSFLQSMLGSFLGSPPDTVKNNL